MCPTCFCLQAMRQNHFILLKILKRQCNQRHEGSVRLLYSYQWSCSLNNKKFQILPTCVLSTLDDVYDTYIEIDNNLQRNINIYNALVVKAHIWFDIDDILHSLFLCSIFLLKTEAIIWVWDAFFLRGSYSIWFSCDTKKAS